MEETEKHNQRCRNIGGNLTLFFCCCCFLFFLKRRFLLRKATKRRKANCYEQTTTPPIPKSPHVHPPLAAKGFSLQPNQRGERTRLTLFWLCLLTLKTLELDDLTVQYKTNNFAFHMNAYTKPYIKLVFFYT